jgi:hypothetical protein
MPRVPKPEAGPEILGLLRLGVEGVHRCAPPDGWLLWRGSLRDAGAV